MNNNKLTHALVSLETTLLLGLATVVTPLNANTTSTIHKEKSNPNVGNIVYSNTKFSNSNIALFSIANPFDLSHLSIEKKFHPDLSNISNIAFNSFKNIQLSIELSSDPEEELEFIQININSNDEDKLDRYLVFVDKISDFVSSELSSKLSVNLA